MAISLQKGQKIDLTKGRAGLSSIMVGLGWDAVKKGGFFSFGSSDIDCDARINGSIPG